MDAARKIKGAKNKCKLCLNQKELRQSHIIPSFVGKWLKNTSVTGYLRKAVKPNKRAQDIVKRKLLCSKCEGLLSKDEKIFSEKVFYPYVKKELDEWGIAKGSVKKIEHEEWLLRFVIGLQWKALMTSEDLTTLKIDAETQKIFGQAIKTVSEGWRKYILGERMNSGESRHYVIFLQNLIAGKGLLPKDISDHVNAYLLRSVDATLAYSKKNMLLFSKMGPVALVSGIKPLVLKGMSDAQVRKKGELKTAQKLRNSQVNEFIFITRPNEAMSKCKLSAKQKRKINQDTMRKVKNAKSLNSIYTTYSDFLLRNKKKSQA